MGWEPPRMDDLFAGTSLPLQSSLAAQGDRHDPQKSPCSQWSISPSSSPAPLAENMSVSCVTRETLQDDCSYTRFVAWVAIKRNSSRLMSSSEKRQCPLLQCRKEFPDLERMLKHLPSCPHLVTREYWCYSCMKVEHFDDVKCKKCISHPSRRRKMLGMAKNLFSTLGNKPRKLPDVTSEFDESTVTVAKYEQPDHVHFESPAQPELSSTEIVEIDSTEIEGPSVSAPDLPVPLIDPQTLLMPELDSVPMQSSMQWQPTPFAQPLTDQMYSAAAAYGQLAARQPGPQVGAQVNPPTGESIQAARSAQAATRSKNLSPSSSVRSTTSTMSNVSNISSVSTSSSLWSAPSIAWSGMETNFTSTSADLVSPLDVFQGDIYNGVQEKWPSNPLDVLPELPADIPNMHELATKDFSLHNALFPFETNSIGENISYPANFSLEDDVPGLVAVQPQEADAPEVFHSETKSMVHAVWDALQEHILSSLVKTQQLDNPLAHQLGLLSAPTIAYKGLASLRSALEGRPCASPLDTLCLIHVIYSSSLVVYRDEAMRRSGEFFAQSLQYASWFTPESRSQFLEMVEAIWQPGELDAAQLNQLLGGSVAPLQWPHSDKGKGPAVGCDGNMGVTDPLLSAARDFLDELETTAVLGSSAEMHASQLRAKHAEGESKQVNLEYKAEVTMEDLSNVLKTLVSRFHDVNGLTTQLSQVNQNVKTGSTRSTRRFELEALQAGQRCIVPSKYFGNYVPLVRSLCDPLYESNRTPGPTSRHEYYTLGISLSETLIAELNAAPIHFPTISPIQSSHDAFFDNLTPPLSDELFEMDIDMQPLVGLGLQDMALQTASISEMASASSPSADHEATGGTNLSRSASTSSYHAAKMTCLSSPSASPTQPAQPAQQPRIETGDCCEICGYRPKGDRRWFHGSMQKHKKLQHSTAPPKIYKCPYPDCNSAYKNRPDNLRQHQIEKNHFVEGEEGAARRPSKRKKVTS